MHGLEDRVGILAKPLRVPGHVADLVPSFGKPHVGRRNGAHVVLKFGAHARQNFVVAVAQSRVQHLIFHRQMQLDDGAHGDDESGDFLGVLTDAGLAGLSELGNTAEDVKVLTFEFVDVHEVGRSKFRASKTDHRLTLIHV